MSDPRKRITNSNFKYPGHMKCYFDNIIHDQHHRGEIKRLFIAAEVAYQESKKKPLKMKDTEIEE